jgi:hypothetical protein
MLTINSHQRSGNVFLNLTIMTYTGNELPVIHDSKVYYDHSIPQIAVFRNPMDALSSKLYKDLEGHIANDTTNGTEQDIVKRELKKDVEEYKQYVADAMANKDSLVIISFEHLKADSDQIALNILNHFNIAINKDLVHETAEEIIEKNNLNDLSSGHMPREKDEKRLQIEEFVRESEDIQEAIDAYNSLEYTIF